jgi:hypothetical protein
MFGSFIVGYLLAAIPWPLIIGLIVAIGIFAGLMRAIKSGGDHSHELFGWVIPLGLLAMVAWGALDSIHTLFR